jgi:hypothetical protein
MFFFKESGQSYSPAAAVGAVYSPVQGGGGGDARVGYRKTVFASRACLCLKSGVGGAGHRITSRIALPATASCSVQARSDDWL